MYNGDGKRIKKIEAGEETNYFYQNDSVLATSDNEDKLTSFNIYGDGANVISTIRNTASVGREYFIYKKDVRGSTSSIVNSQGTAQAIYYYDDFGNTTAKGNFKNEICYTGGIYDDTTGLYYLNARYYSPEDGNFMSQDIYRGEYTNPATLNFYGYCGGNPINYVDPSGHFAISLVLLGKAMFATYAVGIVYKNRKTITTSLKKLCREITISFRMEKASNRELIRTMVKLYIKSIGKLKTKPKYKSTTEKHHIVAQTDRRAKKSRAYLKKLKIKVDNPVNVISLKTGLHRRIHTDSYHQYVRNKVGESYLKSRGKQLKKRQKAMVGTIKKIRGLLWTMNKAARF